MPTKRLVYIVSDVHKSIAFEWIASRLAKDYDLTFVLLNPGPTPLETFLKGHGIKCTRFALRGKWTFPSVFFNLFFYLLSNRPDIVHVHLFEAQRIGLPAAWLARIRKRIYTRHNSTFHHDYQPSGIKYDRLSNLLSTHVISVSQATDHVLNELEHVPVKKQVRIPHGFDWQSFDAITEERIAAVRNRWSIPTTRPVVGMVSRFIEWKGVQFALEGFAMFQEQFPDACLVLANASGPYEAILGGRLSSLDPHHVVRIPFEEDVFALYRTFDLFVHVPIDSAAEAFGQAYIESMASGVPSIVTLSGIACEFVVDRRNALTVPYKDSEAISVAMTELWTNPELRKTIAANAREDVVSRFGIDQMITSLKQVYDE